MIWFGSSILVHWSQPFLYFKRSKFKRKFMDTTKSYYKFILSYDRPFINETQQTQ